MLVRGVRRLLALGLGLACALAVVRGRRATPSVDPFGRRSDWGAVPWEQHVRDFEHAGGRLRYCDFGDGPPLVLLHGMACCWQWWLEVLPTLGRQHRVIAVDLPGFGDSDPLPAPAEIPQHARVVADLLDHLGLDAATVTGHSMGGLVAIALADEAPDLVSRLVLVGSGGVPMSERRLTVVLTLLRASHALFTLRPVLALLARSHTARSILLGGAMQDPAAMSDELAALVAPRLDAPAFADSIRASAAAVRASRPESIRTPTSLIWGELDPLAPLHTAEEMLRRLPDGRLEVLAGVGHSPMVEAPKAFAALLIREAELSVSSLHDTTTGQVQA